MKQHTTGFWQRLKRADLFILLAIVLVIGGVWLFIEVADEVNEGATSAIDQRILLALRNPADPSDPLGPLWVEEAMRDVTALGGGAILLLLTTSVVGYLVIQRRYRAAVLVTLAVVGGSLLSQLLKETFGRARPDLVPHGMHVYTTSFPSGHSMSAAATYLTLAALMTLFQARRRLQIYIMTLALLITGLVGISRVYLGVHWPTDVLAGWTAGAVWAALCGLVMSWLQHRRKIEQHPTADETTRGAEDEDHNSG